MSLPKKTNLRCCAFRSKSQCTSSTPRLLARSRLASGSFLAGSFTRKFSPALLFLFLFSVPGAVNAATTFKDWVETDITRLVDSYILPLLYAILFLLFIFGMFRYFFTGGEENREQGKYFALWSLIAMVAVFAIWGIINILLNVLTF